jgi:hypothetical protein
VVGQPYTVVEQFRDGRLVTEPLPTTQSPGGCDTNVGGTVAAGKVGSFFGYFVIPVTGMQTSTSPQCHPETPPAPCDTATFIASHFAGATFSIPTFFFLYGARDQGLVLHAWRNASCDRGGNAGDIASTAGVAQKSPFCP